MKGEESKKGESGEGKNEIERRHREKEIERHESKGVRHTNRQQRGRRTVRQTETKRQREEQRDTETYDNMYVFKLT